MEKIIKSNKEPSCLKKFKDSRNIDGVPQRTVFTDLRGKEKDEYKKELLAEQYYLCAYCNIRLDDTEEDLKKIKIEHWKPQSICKQDANYGTINCDDLNHQNMIAVCCGENQNPRYNHCDSSRTEKSELTIKPHDPDYFFEKVLKYEGTALLSLEENINVTTDLNIELNLNNDDMKNKRRYALDIIMKEILKIGKNTIDKEILLEKYSKPDTRNKKKQYCTYIRTFLLEKIKTTSQK